MGVLVLKTICLLKCVAEGVVLGEMSLLGTPLCKGHKEEETDALLEVFSSVVRSEMLVLQTMALWSGACVRLLGSHNAQIERAFIALFISWYKGVLDLQN
jgi:hypothetical protein